MYASTTSFAFQENITTNPNIGCHFSQWLIKTAVNKMKKEGASSMRPNFWRSMGLLTGSFHGNSVLILQLGFHPYRGRILTRKFGFCCHLLIQLTSHDDIDSGFCLEWETSHCSFSLVFGAPALPSEAATEQGGVYSPVPGSNCLPQVPKDQLQSLRVNIYNP